MLLLLPQITVYFDFSKFKSIYYISRHTVHLIYSKHDVPEKAK
jgi:hypothetical protein